MRFKIEARVGPSTLCGFNEIQNRKIVAHLRSTPHNSTKHSCLPESPNTRCNPIRLVADAPCMDAMGRLRRRSPQSLCPLHPSSPASSPEPSCTRRPCSSWTICPKSYTYQSAPARTAGRSTTPPYPTKTSAPPSPDPSSRASRSVAPSPTITWYQTRVCE